MLEPSDKYDTVFAVCRFEAANAQHRGQLRQRDFAVVRIVRDEPAAQREVERLNAMNRHKGSVYFYQATRMGKPEFEDQEAQEPGA